MMGFIHLLFQIKSDKQGKCAFRKMILSQHIKVMVNNSRECGYKLDYRLVSAEVYIAKTKLQW